MDKVTIKMQNDRFTKVDHVVCHFSSHKCQYESVVNRQHHVVDIRIAILIHN